MKPALRSRAARWLGGESPSPRPSPVEGEGGEPPSPQPSPVEGEGVKPSRLVFSCVSGRGYRGGERPGFVEAFRRTADLAFPAWRRSLRVRRLRGRVPGFELLVSSWEPSLAAGPGTAESPEHCPSTSSGRTILGSITVFGMDSSTGPSNVLRTGSGRTILGSMTVFGMDSSTGPSTVLRTGSG